MMNQEFIKEKISGKDYSAVLYNFFTSNNYTSDDKALACEKLGPSFTEDACYYLYNGVVYKVEYDSNNIITTVTETNIDASTFGVNGNNITIVNGTYEIIDSFYMDELGENVYEIDPLNDGSELYYTSLHIAYVYTGSGLYMYSESHGGK